MVNDNEDRNSVNIKVGKDIIDPIVLAQIKSGIIAAMGGKEDLIDLVVNNIITKKVDEDGKVSSYSSENKFTWLDVVLNNQIEKVSREAITEIIANESENIKKALVEILKSKEGSSLVARALIDSMNGSFSQKWTSSFKIDFTPTSRD